MKNNLYNKKISVVIPVYNEEKTIEEILKKVLEETKNWQKEITVVNDGSDDRTLEKLKEFSNQIVLINLPKNQGKGFALREGLKKASGEIIIIQDGDLEYSPKDYQKLLTPILEDKTKVVYGSRNLNPENEPFSRIYLYGGKLITSFFNLLFKTNLTDINTGYKFFKKEVLNGISLREDGFSFCEEFTAKVVKKGFSILEVPISYKSRSFKEGKKIRLLDGLKAVFAILKYYFFE